MKAEKYSKRGPPREWMDNVDKMLLLINNKLNTIIAKENIMANELSDLEAQVAENTSIEQSAIILIEGIADQLEQAQQDPVKLAALRDSLRTSATALGAAVAAHTTPAPPA